MEIRSFLAFELPQEIRRSLYRLSREMRQLLLNVKWVKPDNMHLTLIFMGNVEEKSVPDMSEACKEICSSYGPFKVVVNGVGIFGGIHNPRVLWIGLDGDMDKISHLKRALHKELKPFGIKEEKRPFKPHLTLGRFSKGRYRRHNLTNLLEKYGDISSPVCTLTELVLFRSDLRRTGAVYTKLDTYALSGRTKVGIQP